MSDSFSPSTPPGAGRQPNPYTPGFNQAPMVFAGRTEVLDAAGEALEIAAFDGRTPRPLIFVGPRGVGKTVTLGQISDAAGQQHGWPTVHVEATPGRLIDVLTARLRDAEDLFNGTVPSSSSSSSSRSSRSSRSRITGAKVEAIVLGVGGGVEVSRDTNQEQPSLRDQLRTTMESARNRDAGLVITLDELQNASTADLHEIGGVLQENVPANFPLVIAIAALPSLREKRGNRLPTYLERAEWHPLESLPGSDAREALTAPASQSGRPMTTEAADLLLSQSGGYPYAIQVAGHFAWRTSTGSDTITEEHARAAIPRIEADLDQLFLSRWDGASMREKEYLLALAEVQQETDEPNGGHVAEKMGEATQAVSYLRDRLIKKGTIYRSGAGGLHFITPGMARWVRNRAAD